MKWHGVLETSTEVEADSEIEAEKKMVELLIERLKSGETKFIVWQE